MHSKLKWHKGLNREGQVIYEAGYLGINYEIDRLPIKSKPWVLVLPDGTGRKTSNINNAKALAEADLQRRFSNGYQEEGNRAGVRPAPQHAVLE